MDKDKFNMSMELSFKHHKNGVRKRAIGGVYLPYICHPFAVMNLLFKWGVGNYEDLAIAVCHDLLEDTQCTYKEIKTFVSEAVAEGVLGLTFVPDNFDKSAKEKYIASFADKPIALVVVKLADRFKNIEDFKLTDPKYAKKYFEKAIPLFTAYLNRRSEVCQKYGENVDANILTTYQYIKELVDSEKYILN